MGRSRTKQQKGAQSKLAAATDGGRDFSAAEVDLLRSLVRDLVLLSVRWETFYRHARLRHGRRIAGDIPPRVLAITRTLRAAAIAYCSENDTQLSEIDKAASAYLVHEGKQRLADTGTQMLSVREIDFDGQQLALAVEDIVPVKWVGNRRQVVRTMCNTLVWTMERSARADANELAHTFLFNASMPFALGSILAELDCGIDQDDVDARTTGLAPAFERLIRSRRAETREEKHALAERLFVCGMKSLGVKKHVAETLVEDRAQEKRIKRVKNA